MNCNAPPFLENGWLSPGILQPSAGNVVYTGVPKRRAFLTPVVFPQLVMPGFGNRRQSLGASYLIAQPAHTERLGESVIHRAARISSGYGQ